MKYSLQNRQRLACLSLLAVAALLAVISYHRLHQDMVLFRQGEQRLARQDYRGAIPFLIGSFQKGNSSQKLLKDLGNACRLAEVPMDVDAYRLYLAANPADRTVRISLARSLSAQGRYSESVTEYRKLLGEMP
jgi:hypothetical protein